MRRYHDLHAHIAALEKKGLLVRVKRPMNKDTEIHPLVRWQFRGGLEEKERRGFLFENVHDAKGRKYTMPVAVGVMAASQYIYAVGMQCELDEVEEKWKRALANPIPPVIVDSGPVHDEIHRGEELFREGGGFDEFPVPISTPGFDNAPYTTCTHWFTKDPETGVRNAGNYRGQIKGRAKVGIFPSNLGQDVYIHWGKAKAKGMPLEAALVIGGPPIVSYAAVQKVPYGVDELAVAGGLAGEPIQLVRCKTVGLEVPADAEIVFEGHISTEFLEPEGPFGESHGYMHPRQLNPYMDIKCITHRKDAIWVSFISQVTPSESSVIKKVGYEPMFFRHIKNTLSIKSVTRVVMHEPLTNLRKLIVIQMKKPSESEVWRALMGAVTFHQGVGKIVIAVDEDIDPDNLDAVMWAMSYRMKPHKDVQIVRGLEKGHAPPFADPDQGGDVVSHTEAGADESALLVNAILREPFPPISLPKKEYMENAKKIWEELGLPKLKPQSPWYGYSLGQWTEELAEEADLAVRGEHYKTGEKQAGRKVKA